MSSCPSQAHALALKTFEEHNNAMLDERMKDIVERTENNLANTSPDHILQEVSNKIVGKRQMTKLIEQAEAADAKLLFE